jgi:hypothetical protein
MRILPAAILTAAACALAACGAGPTGGPAPGLQPSTVGDGQCPATSPGGGSTVAEFALAGGATCRTAEVVAKQAAVAQGNPYVADGFSCSATAEGPVSRWSLAWGGTYYAYSCTDGSLEVAFAWGTDYTYSG